MSGRSQMGMLEYPDRLPTVISPSEPLPLKLLCSQEQTEKSPSRRCPTMLNEVASQSLK